MIQNSKAAADFSFHPAKDLTVAFGASQLHARGRGPWGHPSASARTSRFPEPIDTTAKEAYLDIGIAKKGLPGGPAL